MTPVMHQSTLSFEKKGTNVEKKTNFTKDIPEERRKRRRVIKSDDESDENKDTVILENAKSNSEESSRSGKHLANSSETDISQGGKKNRASRRKTKIKTDVSGDEEQSVPGSSTLTVQGDTDPEIDDIDQEIKKLIDEVKEEKAAAHKLAASSRWDFGNMEAETTWKKGEPVPYGALCKTFEAIEATTKRLIISELLTKFLCQVIAFSPEHLLPTIYLCINKIAPEYEGLELGIGEGLLIKAIAEVTGRSVVQIKKDYQETGDLGIVAKNSKANQPMMFKPKPLTVPGVFQALKEIALASGQSSQSRKVGIIKKLMGSCVGGEAKWIIRSLEGKLRIGLAGQTILVALAHAIVLSSSKKRNGSHFDAALEKAAETVKQVFSELPSYDVLVPALLEHGVENLQDVVKITPGVPLKPMLAKPTKAIMEVLDRFEGKPFTCEFKYDGERAQIHLTKDGKPLIFSRNLENISGKYPDVLNNLQKYVKDETKSFVLDSEVVAWDTKENRILPFQILSTRKRKDVTEDSIKVKVCIFAFDILYLNDESLLGKTFQERRELLRNAFNDVKGEFAFAEYNNGTSLEEIQTFLDDSVKGNCEGLMVKMLQGEESHYEPSRRSMHWLKVKKDYLSGIGDSLDLVVIGAYYGRGKRTNVYGAFLLACYDPDAEEYQTICKIGTGFSDQDLDNHYKSLKDFVIEKPRGYFKYSEATKPDVWFEPKQVWEVLTADLSLSPVYQAAVGIIDSNKGISLRFPRFLGVREDKGPDDATSADQVAEMYGKQIVIASRKKAGDGGDGVDDGFDY